MKKIEAIIKPFKMDEIKEALDSIGINEMTVTEVKGFQSNSSGSNENSFESEAYIVDYVPKSKIEIIIEDSMLEKVVSTICEVGSIGKVGNGKIFVYDVIDAVSIRTGERGDEAL